MDGKRGRRLREMQLGAAHTNPADAYKNVPILRAPTWGNEVAAYFFFGGMSAGAAMIGSLAGLALPSLNAQTDESIMVSDRF